MDLQAERDRLVEGFRRYMIPDYMRNGILNYIIDGHPPGSWLCSLFNNDLKRVYGGADSTNIELIRNYVQFLWDYAPNGCWGASDAVERWSAHHGLRGLFETPDPGEADANV